MASRAADQGTRTNGKGGVAPDLAALHDRSAAEAVVGAMLVPYGDAVSTVLAHLVPGDFGFPSLDAALSAIAALYEEGAPVDVRCVLAELDRQGTRWPEASADLVSWLADAPSPSAVGRLCARLVELRVRRATLAACYAGTSAAADLSRPIADVVGEVKEGLAAVEAAMPTAPGDVLVDDLLAEPDETRDIVLPGAVLRDGRQRPPLLCVDDRAIFVGPEGAGKSEFFRQVLVCASAGLHPFAPSQTIEPVPSLLVDLENPRSAVKSRLSRLELLAASHSQARAPLSLWLQPGGIDLRKRADRLAFEDVLRRRRPRLVSFGPVYKSYSRKASESDEQIAGEVQGVLDDLRVRFGFALLLEGHAGHGEYGVREMRPFGSSLWLRWPEFGIGLLAAYRDQAGNLRAIKAGRVKSVPDALLFDRFRGDRNVASWPSRVDRGDAWPWLGYYPAPEEVFR